MTVRKYEPVWSRIKLMGRCTVEVQPFLVPRVKKAIIKEKNRDAAFKMINAHDNFFLEFSYDEKKKYLKTILKQTLGLQGVKTEAEFLAENNEVLVIT